MGRRAAPQRLPAKQPGTTRRCSAPITHREFARTVASTASIKGVEVYAGIGAPPQFQEGMRGCGSIVIWMRQVTHGHHAGVARIIPGSPKGNVE